MPTQFFSDGWQHGFMMGADIEGHSGYFFAEGILLVCGRHIRELHQPAVDTDLRNHEAILGPVQCPFCKGGEMYGKFHLCNSIKRYRRALEAVNRARVGKLKRNDPYKLHQLHAKYMYFGPLPKLPTTGKYTHKPYRCTRCGTEKSIGTNHWGECYPYCHKCNNTTVWECLEPVPEGFGKPEPWKLVKLGDIAEIGYVKHIGTIDTEDK